MLPLSHQKWKGQTGVLGISLLQENSSTAERVVLRGKTEAGLRKERLGREYFHNMCSIKILPSRQPLDDYKATINL